MPDRRLHLYGAQITSLQLSQVTLQPEFNLDNVTCIYTSVCSIMFYYSGGDLRYEWTTLITWFINRETSQICFQIPIQHQHIFPYFKNKIRFSVLAMRIWPKR